MKVKVAQSGPTADGREIKPEWLRDIASTYNPSTYAARLWIEHLRGISPASDFRACGTVSGVSADEADGVVSLYAELELNDYAKELSKTDQKIFTSIEVTENFADSNKAYLTGLALTDSPASLGLDAIKFSKASSFNTPHKGCHTFHQTGELTLAATSAANDDNKNATPALSLASITAAFTQALRGVFKSEPAKSSESGESSEPNTTVNFQNLELSDADVQRFASAIGSTAHAQIAPLFATQQAQIDALTTALQQATADAQAETKAFGSNGRPPAKGGEAATYIKAEC
jgi:hypothetical protein